ncbi:hypothetical protein NDU88_006309 [Pleurodeles waltl]|uniref:Uncharacterized protein n=1 Tax=Pleurodeles waltl TaxID=8319 RepID=A0AAV7RPW4_PLEWA|nr:hypothetical protein NDU88_006309 [Pleurodeles waltl]
MWGLGAALRSSLTPRSKRSLRVGRSPLGERFRVPIVYRLLATKSTRGPRLLTWCTRASDGSIEMDSPSEVGPPRRSWFSADGPLSPRQSARAGCGPAGARRLLLAVRRTRSGRPPAFFFFFSSRRRPVWTGTPFVTGVAGAWRSSTDYSCTAQGSWVPSSPV